MDPTYQLSRGQRSLGKVFCSSHLPGQDTSREQASQQAWLHFLSLCLSAPPQSGMAPQAAATVKSSFRCHSGSKETQIPEDPCQTHRGASTQGCGHSSLPWHIQEADRLYNFYRCPTSPPTTMTITLLSMDEPGAGQGDGSVCHSLSQGILVTSSLWGPPRW